MSIRGFGISWGFKFGEAAPRSFEFVLVSFETCDAFKIRYQFDAIGPGQSTD